MFKKSGMTMRLKGMCLFIGLLMCASVAHVYGKDRVNNESQTVSRFSWNADRKLSWADFKGPVNTESEESAAATCCAIGFKLLNNESGAPEITVYNTFYIDKSWVKEDARIGSILAHEQGHFDLCELYTRQLKSRLATVDLKTPNVKQELMAIYAAVNAEYEARQQAYEHETTHGTILHEQYRWEKDIANELASNTELASIK